MLAIVSHNRNQYLFEEGQNYDIVLNASDLAKKEIVFSSILLISDGKKNLIGQPQISAASVKAQILDIKKSEKVSVFKFHSKKRYQRNRSQRQTLATVKIIKISSSL